MPNSNRLKGPWPWPSPTRRSISARSDCAGLRPCSPSRASMKRKRRMNFSFAARKALSGSIFRWRATLATTNSRSPNSSSIFGEAAAPARSRCDRLLQLGQLLLELLEHGRQRGPVEADPRGFVLQLDGARQRRQPTGTSPSRPASASALSSPLVRSQNPGAAPAARSASVPNTCGWRRIILAVIASTTSANANALALLGHARVIDDLQQQIAQLVLQAVRDHRGRSHRRPRRPPRWCKARSSRTSA